VIYILELNKSKIKQNLLSGRVRSVLGRSRLFSPTFARCVFLEHVQSYRSVVKSAGQKKNQLQIFAFIPYNKLSEAILLKLSEFSVIVTVSSVRKEESECVNKCSV
jgi:hypothetical protein